MYLKWTSQNLTAPVGIERDSIPTYHETHVFATVKIGSYKFLAEWGSVYWLTAYYISMPPPPPRPPTPLCTGAIHKKNAVPNPISRGPYS